MAASATTTELNLVFDYFNKIANELLGDRETWGYGQYASSVLDDQPDWGARNTLNDLETDFLSDWSNLEACNLMGPAIVNLRGNLNISTTLVNAFSDSFSRISQIIQTMSVSAGISRVEEFLSYYNTGAGGTNTMLQGPGIRLIQESLGVSVDRGNYYFPVMGGLHLGAQVAGVFVPATATIPAGKYAGGRPSAVMTDHTGGDNGAITVTGTAWDPATRTEVAGVTWVSTGGDFTGVDIERYLISGGGNPAPANALILAVSGITGVAATNAIKIESSEPAGRIPGGTWLE